MKDIISYSTTMIIVMILVVLYFSLPGKRRRSSVEREGPETTPRPKTTPERGDARPPMLAYGWADSKRDVGGKKTFNVRASMHGDVS